jgi:SAM-dependent methyltransferase
MDLLARLKQRYREELFHPGWLALVINPFYFARAGLRDAMVAFAPSLHGRLLDVGCGSKPYRRYFRQQEYVGLDIDTKANRQAGVADFFYDGVRFPFQDASFDAVLCNQVLEHVFNPQEFLGEIRRVLKPGGRLLLTVPFVWDEHEQPYDCARYTSFGLRHLFEQQGLRWLEHRKLGGDASILFQLTNAYLFKVGRRLPKWWFLLFSVTAMAAVNCLGVAARRLLPDNDDLFLDHVVLAENTE